MSKIKRPPHVLSDSLTGSACLVGSVLCWGTVPVLLRHLTGSIDAWTANGFRYALSALLYWPVLIFAWKSGRLNRRVVACCLVPSLLAFGGQVFWALAPYYLPASAIGFFIRAAMVWSLIGAMALFPDERQLLRLPIFHVGLLLTVIGFLALSASKVRLDVEVTSTGIAVILICGMFFGLYAVSIRYFLTSIHPVLAFGLVSQLVSLGTLAAMFAMGDYGILPTLTMPDWGTLIASSLLGIALGHALVYAAVNRLGTSVTTGAQTLTPFVTLSLATLILGETMTVLEWSGGMIMVAGAAALLMSQQALVKRAKRTDAKN